VAMRGAGTSVGFFQRSFPLAFGRTLFASAAVFLSLAVSFAHAQDSAISPSPISPPSSPAEASASDIRTARFDDWQLRCVVAGGASAEAAQPASCEISQPLMVNQDGGSVEVLNLAVSRASDKAGKVDWALVVLTPLDVHLASDFGYGVGSGKPELVRYRNCNHAGCFVVVPLDNSRVSQLKKASDGAAFFRLLNGQAVKVSFSLKGFTKAFNALSAGQVPASGQETEEVAARVTTRSDSEGSDN